MSNGVADGSVRAHGADRAWCLWRRHSSSSQGREKEVFISPSIDFFSMYIRLALCFQIRYVLKKIRLARQTERCRRSAHQEVIFEHQSLFFSRFQTRFLYYLEFVFFFNLTGEFFQMSLIARVQHPYIVEFKEAWVEKASLQ